MQAILVSLSILLLKTALFSSLHCMLFRSRPVQSRPAAAAAWPGRSKLLLLSGRGSLSLEARRLCLPEKEEIGLELWQLPDGSMHLLQAR